MTDQSQNPAATPSLADLYQRHRQNLFTLALAITHSRPSAEDAVHDAFARLCRRQWTASDPAAYVFAAVRNAARDLTTRRKTSDLPLDLFASDPTTHDAAESAELAELVRQALTDLDPAQREVLVMKLWGDLTFDQISALTGLPLQTLASRYRRALQKIKTSIGSRV